MSKEDFEKHGKDWGIMSLTPAVLKTSRLVLRPWKLEDFEPLARLNADPRVMEYFPSIMSQEESLIGASAHIMAVARKGI